MTLLAEAAQGFTSPASLWLAGTNRAKPWLVSCGLDWRVTWKWCCGAAACGAPRDDAATKQQPRTPRGLAEGPDPQHGSHGTPKTAGSSWTKTRVRRASFQLRHFYEHHHTTRVLVFHGLSRNKLNSHSVFWRDFTFLDYLATNWGSDTHWIWVFLIPKNVNISSQ